MAKMTTLRPDAHYESGIDLSRSSADFEMISLSNKKNNKIAANSSFKLAALALGQTKLPKI
jgi:hypothetical protein